MNEYDQTGDLARFNFVVKLLLFIGGLKEFVSKFQ